MPPSSETLLYRRADWQWLLPRRRFERALCLADGELRASAHAVLAEGLQCVDEPAGAHAEGTFDLVLAAAGDRRTLERAMGALRPGGVLYIECGSVGGSTLRRIAANLRASGFAAVRPVVLWDVSDAERGWLPLDSTAALHYFFVRHPVPARHPLRRLWLNTRRLAALARMATACSARHGT